MQPSGSSATARSPAGADASGAAAERPPSSRLPRMARRRDAASAALLAAAILAVALLSAPRSGAAGEPAFNCKGVHTGKAQIDPNPKGRAPVAIGDSTMILPIPNLGSVGFSVNARGCRGFKESDRKSTRLNSSHLGISYAVFCLKKQ